MRVLLGIDDTDNLESRGTGYRARQLGLLLAESGLAQVRGISRHQLFVHPDIRYTSHNSALCIDLAWGGQPLSELADLSRSFLLAESAPGSDAAFCIAAFDDIPDEVVTYGRCAKNTVLNQQMARDLAQRTGIHLEGVTGDEGGVIGALACVGLRKSGHDGRFVWVAGVRELTGVASVAYLLGSTGIDIIQTPDDEILAADARVLVDPWPRPVLLGDKAVLLIEKIMEGAHGDHDWKIVPKEIIKQY